MSADVVDDNNVWDVKNVICYCSFTFCCACNLVT